jgi:hypothetical protein
LSGVSRKLSEPIHEKNLNRRTPNRMRAIALLHTLLLLSFLSFLSFFSFISLLVCPSFIFACSPAFSAHPGFFLSFLPFFFFFFFSPRAFLSCCTSARMQAEALRHRRCLVDWEGEPETHNHDFWSIAANERDVADSTLILKEYGRSRDWFQTLVENHIRLSQEILILKKKKFARRNKYTSQIKLGGPMLPGCGGYTG